MSESKYWLSFWAMVFVGVIALGCLIVLSDYLDDKRDLEMANKGLQKYKVERCSAIYIRDEWHEAGWKDAN